MTEDYQRIIQQNAQAMEPIPTGVEPRLAALREVKVVALDVYGTLVISGSGDVGMTATDRREQALVEALRACNGPEEIDPGPVLATLDAAILGSHESAREQGVPFPEVDIVSIWQSVFNQLANSIGLLRDWAFDDWRQFALQYETRVNPVCPMPHASEMLRSLREKGMVMGIVSNAQFFTPVILETLFHDSLEGLGFDIGLTYFSYAHMQAKPGTYLYRQLRFELENRNVSPTDVLYIGNDMLNDVAAAAESGFRTMLFAGDQRSLRWREGVDRVKDIQPDAIITHWSQLTECLH